MQIILKQEELEVAVRDYMLKCGISRTVGDISFTATRSGGSGIITEVEITDESTSESSNPTVVEISSVIKRVIDADLKELAPVDDSPETASKSLFS